MPRVARGAERCLGAAATGRPPITASTGQALIAGPAGAFPALWRREGAVGAVSRPRLVQGRAKSPQLWIAGRIPAFLDFISPRGLGQGRRPILNLRAEGFLLERRDRGSGSSSRL